MQDLKRLERLMAILLLLREGKNLTAQEMATYFEVNVRTIYRDMRALDAAGVPLVAEREGYSLVEGYHLPPINLSEEEALAVLSVEKLVQKNGEASLVKHFHTLAQKVRAALRPSLRNELKNIEGKLGLSLTRPHTQSSFLIPTQQAILKEKVLLIEYENSEKEKTVRKIEPLAIYFTDFNWLTIAYCHLREDLRDFRLDRIIALKEVKDKKNYFNFNLLNYLLEREKA